MWRPRTFALIALGSFAIFLGVGLVEARADTLVPLPAQAQLQAQLGRRRPDRFEPTLNRWGRQGGDRFKNAIAACLAAGGPAYLADKTAGLPEAEARSDAARACLAGFYAALLFGGK